MNNQVSLSKEIQLLLTAVVFLLSACQAALPTSTSTTPVARTSTQEAASKSTGVLSETTSINETPTPAPRTRVEDQDWEFRVDGNLAWYVEHAPLAGATIAIRRSDERLFMHAYGLESASPAIPAKVDTIYEIGSITNQFTAAAILLLAEKHSLRLGDPITRYLAALPPNLSGIQIRHLLNHTSGLIEPEAYFSLFEDSQAYTPQEILEKTAGELETNAEPGTSWAYSNFGYFMLGMIIEEASGQPYADYLAEHIFRPAGMQSTCYCPDAGAPTARGYVYENRAFQPVKWNMSVAYSAVGLCSTAVDLLAWQRALVRGEVLRMTSYLEMITPISPEEVKENYAPYGYGVFIQDDQGKKIIHHGGYVYGTESYLLYYPEYDLTIVMLSNTSTISTRIFDFVRSNIVPIIFGE